MINVGYYTKIPNLLHKASKIGLYALSSTKNSIDVNEKIKQKSQGK